MTDWRSVWQEKTSRGCEVLFAAQDANNGRWFTVERNDGNVMVNTYHPNGYGYSTYDILITVTQPTRNVLGGEGAVVE